MTIPLSPRATARLVVGLAALFAHVAASAHAPRRLLPDPSGSPDRVELEAARSLVARAEEPIAVVNRCERSVVFQGARVRAADPAAFEILEHPPPGAVIRPGRAALLWVRARGVQEGAVTGRLVVRFRGGPERHVPLAAEPLRLLAPDGRWIVPPVKSPREGFRPAGLRLPGEGSGIDRLLSVLPRPEGGVLETRGTRDEEAPASPLRPPARPGPGGPSRP
jgi:hypothetical protein